MPTLTAVYLEDFSRIKLEAGDLAPEVVYSIQRSTDGGTTWVPVRGATNITDGGVTVVYDYEFAPGIENLYELVAPAVSDTFERDTGPGGLVLTGASGNASTPDAAALDITGDIDIRAVIAFPDYSSGTLQTIIAKYMTTGDQRSYDLRVNATGNLQFVFSVNGTAGNTATATTTLYDAGKADGDLIAVRVTRVAATGAITFYIGSEPVLQPDSWETTGAVISGTTGNLFAGTAPLEVGSANNGAGDRATGTVVMAQVRSGINGTIAANPNFAQQPTGTNSFADSTGKTWTHTGAATILGNDQAWGSADTGQLWNLHTDSSTDAVWEVRSGAGRVVAPDNAFGTWSRYLNVNLDDIDARMDFYMPDIATGANDEAEIWMILRGTADNDDGYAIRVFIEASTRTTTIRITGAGTSPTVTLADWQPGQRWRIRARTVGTVIEARAWNTANPEPNTWHVTASSMAFTSGTVGLLLSGLTNDAIDQLFDNVIVTDVPAAAAASASVTPLQADVWLKSIAYPSLNINIGCPLTGPMTRRGRGGIFDVKGSPLPVGIEDVGSTEATSITFVTRSEEENRAVVALLTYGSPLLLQSPPDDDPTGCANARLTPTGWYARGDSVQSRPLVGKRAWLWVVPLTRVAAPSSLILPAHMTWDVLWQIAATWAEVWDEWSTWAELWNATIAPDIVYDALMGD